MTLNQFLPRFLIFVFLSLLPAGGRYQSETNQIQVNQNRAVMNFPSPITFDLHANASTAIQLVNLRYGTSGRTCETGFTHRNLKFKPASSVALSWSWHLREEGLYLPPGAKVWWQWLIHTSDEQSLLTEIDSLTIRDPDHAWQSIQQDNIQLEWFEGDSTFSQLLLEVAIRSQERLDSEAGLQTPENIHLLVYPDADTIHSATLHLPEWTGGVAYPEFNTALVAVAPSQTSWGRLVIPHEIAHLIIAARIFNCHGSSLPLWMVEGFSKFAEGPMTVAQMDSLRENLQTGGLPNLKDLVDHFPYEAGPASQAYLASQAAVNYLLEIGGQQVFSSLINQVQAGEQFEQAMLDLYGYRTETLDQAWQAALGFGKPPARQTGLSEEGPLSLSNQPESVPNSSISESPQPDFPLLPKMKWNPLQVVQTLGLVGLAAGLAILWLWGKQIKK